LKPFLANSHSYTLSVEDAGLVRGDHVLDVDEGILAAVGLEKLKCLLDQVTNVEPLTLRVVNLVAQVVVDLLEHVHHGQDLAVVGHKGLANGVGAGHQSL